jgi:hypothetical protein
MLKLKNYIYLYYLGLFSLFLGSLDPLEGSILILIGFIFISIFMKVTHNKFAKYFIFASSISGIGIFFMFYFSFLGGFFGNSTLNKWYLLLLLPYPLGWLLFIILLVTNFFESFKKK